MLGILAGIATFTYSPAVNACSCPPPGDPLEGAEYALLGTVSEDERVPASVVCGPDDIDSGYLYTIHVDEWFIGEGDAEIQVFSTGSNPSCGFHLSAGQQWVLFPVSACDADFYVALCMGNALASNSAELLHRLRDLDNDGGSLADADAGVTNIGDGGATDAGPEEVRCIDYCGQGPWYYEYCYCSAVPVRSSAVPGELIAIGLLAVLSLRRRKQRRGESATL